MITLFEKNETNFYEISDHKEYLEVFTLDGNKFKKLDIHIDSSFSFISDEIKGLDLLLKMYSIKRIENCDFEQSEIFEFIDNVKLLYVGSSFVYCDIQIWKKIFATVKKLGNKEIYIYRGCYDFNKDGISWSYDENIAWLFGNEVVSKKVLLNDCVVLGGKEKEVIYYETSNI